MPSIREFVVADDEGGARLDVLLAARAGLSRARAAELIEHGGVEVSGVAATRRSLRVDAGTRVRVEVPDEATERPPVGEPIDVAIAYEDRWLMVVSKPAGLVVHPAPGHTGGTLVNALLARAETPAGGEAWRPGIVHRLDAGTSGLLIVAKDEQVHDTLVEAMAARQIARAYLALVEGNPDSDTITIDAPIGRSPRHRKKMAVVADGKDARTEVTVLERHRETALVEARPYTGRTHQIRVHLAAAGHPVVGDEVYGRRRRIARALQLRRPFLHAARLSFTHPVGGETIALSDPLPADLEIALERARSLV